MSRFHRGGPAFLKPENALKRAEELIAVGQPRAALQTLHDVITSKRHRTWQKVLEQIITRYIDLCVLLKKGREAKDGLIHYRNVCQQVNVSSLEEVIKYFLKSATDKAEEAQSKADMTVALAVADLEVEATPEDLMLSYVSGEKGKDRTDREMVTPWFKFLWETYRTILDVLRNNARLETLYAMTAAKAFNFCLNYKRTTEFRRLCDILRNHLNSLNKYQYRDQRDRPDLQNPDTLQLFLDTRFEQLKVACDLELWQEAFRSVEDIQNLFLLGKRPGKPQTMAIFYARLTRIFTVSENHLQNGYAWYRLFNLAKTYNKNLTQADNQQLACNVLLSALSILPYEPVDFARTENDLEIEKDRSMRMASILGFKVDPRRDPRTALSRQALLSDLTAKGLLSLVPEPIKQLYTTLESDFSPLKLCEKLAPLLDQLDTLNQPLSSASPVQDVDLGHYKTYLQQVAVLRLLKQLSTIYSTLKISKLKKLIPFMDFGKVEALIVDAVQNDFIHVRVDHKNGSIHFNTLDVESEQLRGHIAVLATRLTKAVGMISPAADKQIEGHQRELIVTARETAIRDNERMHGRKVLIEKKKEEQERLLLQAEKEEEERRLVQERLSVAAEEERRRLDRLKREEDRIQREMAEREEEEARAVLEQAAKTGKIKIPLGGEKLDKQAILTQVRTEQQKAKDEAEKKLMRYIRHLDHFERACREEEAPIIQKEYEVQLVEDEKLFIAEQKRLAEVHRQAWEEDIKEKERLSRMADAKNALAEEIMSRRKTEFEALRAERDREIQRLKEEKRQARELQRRIAYVQRCRQEIKEKREEEEAEALRLEEERKQQEEELRLQKLAEQAEKMRKREAELEEKAKAEREAVLKREPTSQATSSGSGVFVPAHRRRAEAAPARTDGGDRWARREPAPAAPQKDSRPAGDTWKPRTSETPPAPAAAPAAASASVAAPAASTPAASTPAERPAPGTAAPAAGVWRPKARDTPQAAQDGGGRWGGDRNRESSGAFGPRRDGPGSREGPRDRDQRERRGFGTSRDSRDAAPPARPPSGSRW